MGGGSRGVWVYRTQASSVFLWRRSDKRVWSLLDEVILVGMEVARDRSFVVGLK